jgi:hypothetical protein
VIVTLICALSSLEILSLGFKSPQSRPDLESRSPAPPKRSILPALDQFHFNGVAEYLEDLVTFIDAPQLKTLHITFFNQIDFDTPRLAQFISRAPKLGKRDAHVQFHGFFASVVSGTLEIISCIEPDRQLSFIEQICNSSLHPFSTVEDLYIEHRYSELVWNVDAIENCYENTQWLQLLLTFTAVNNLYLSKVFVPGIVTALQEFVGGTITEVLPSLQNIFIEELEPSGLFQENIGRLVAARRLSDHPIAISVWDNDSKMKPMCYIPHS